MNLSEKWVHRLYSWDIGIRLGDIGYHWDIQSQELCNMEYDLP